MPLHLHLCRSHKLRWTLLMIGAFVCCQYVFGYSVKNIHLLTDRYYGTKIADDKIDLDGMPSSELVTSATQFMWSNTSLTDSESNATDSAAVPVPNTTIAASTSPVLVNVTFAPQPASLEMCPVLPPVLVGPIRVYYDKPTMEEIEALNPRLEAGGHGKPQNCTSRHKVAIIIPFRDRWEQLRVFLHNLHDLLTKQQLDYAIFIVEQIGNQTFNRAKLMNVGFVEALRYYDWKCFIFHDVDLMPQDDRNIYGCPEQPRHMSVAIDKFNYKLPYTDIFGGITALTVEQFQKLNGFSNDFWGWGGEDDEMASRVKLAGFKISRYPNEISRYTMMKHAHEGTNPVNKCRYNLMYKVKKRWERDGLSSLKYRVVKRQLMKLITVVTVDLLEEYSKHALESERIC